MAIKIGELSSGKTWGLVKSRKKMVEKHLILYVIGDPIGTLKTKEELLQEIRSEEKKSEALSPEEIPEVLEKYLVLEEKQELLGLSLLLGKEQAIVPGRFRIGFNAKGVATRPTFHIHIMCPREDEKLPPLVPRATHE